MWPDRVSNPGPLTYESGALPTALRGPADNNRKETSYMTIKCIFCFGMLLFPSFFKSLIHSIDVHKISN